MNGQDTSRVKPVEPPYPAEMAEAFDRIMSGRPPLLIFRTAARNPRILHKMMGGNLLDRGSIDRLDREILILRACALCGAEYEWGVHVAAFAARFGLSDAQIIDTTRTAIDPALWSTTQQLLLLLVDSLHTTYDLPDALWSALKDHFTDEQLIEILMVTGQYHQISMLVRALRLSPEPGVPRFPSVALSDF